MQITIARQTGPSADGSFAPPAQLLPRKLLLVDDHELVRCGV